MKAIRCGSGNLFGRELDNGLVEIKCRNRHCKDHDGQVVYHQFDKDTWEIVNTTKFKDPA